MIDLLKKIGQLSKILAVTLVLFIFLFTPTALANIGMDDVDGIFESVQVKGGKFSVDITVPIERKIRIGSAIVSLPDDETGIIEEIAITGPKGKIFGCVNQEIEDGTDLIESCGGPAYLIPGDTRYEAKGSNFKPEPNVTFGIELSE